jgi:GGDEF domain-containing protein
VRDIVGRYGGDEFMVLITSTTEEQAVSFAGNLREKISTTDISARFYEKPENGLGERPSLLPIQPFRQHPGERFPQLGEGVRLLQYP